MRPAEPAHDTPRGGLAAVYNLPRNNIIIHIGVYRHTADSRPRSLSRLRTSSPRIQKVAAQSARARPRELTSHTTSLALTYHHPHNTRPQDGESIHTHERVPHALSPLHMIASPQRQPPTPSPAHTHTCEKPTTTLVQSRRVHHPARAFIAPPLLPSALPHGVALVAGCERLLAKPSRPTVATPPSDESQRREPASRRRLPPPQLPPYCVNAHRTHALCNGVPSAFRLLLLASHRLCSLAPSARR